VLDSRNRRLAVATGDDAGRLPGNRSGAGQTDHHPVEVLSPPSDTPRELAPTAHSRLIAACAVAQPKRSGRSLSAKVLLGNLISGS
jgi:hypothetical protein